MMPRLCPEHRRIALGGPAGSSIALSFITAKFSRSSGSRSMRLASALQRRVGAFHRAARMPTDSDKKTRGADGRFMGESQAERHLVASRTPRQRRGRRAPARLAIS